MTWQDREWQRVRAQALVDSTIDLHLAHGGIRPAERARDQAIADTAAWLGVLTADMPAKPLSQAQRIEAVWPNRKRTVDIRDREPCSTDRLDDWCNRVANLLITVQVARADATQANT